MMQSSAGKGVIRSLAKCVQRVSRCSGQAKVTHGQFLNPNQRLGDFSVDIRTINKDPGGVHGVMAVAGRRKRRMNVNTKVLVVEDDLEINELIGEYLALENIKYLQATTGQEGIHQAIATHPDAIILDLMLPDVDGFEVARAL